MSNSKYHSAAMVIIFSLLIVLSSLAAVNPPFQIVGAETARGEGNTWYVDDDAPDGGDGSLDMPYQKIQDAVNASENGDTIRVFTGTYYENVRVNKAVNLIGNGSKDTTIDGGGSGDVVNIIVDWVNMSGFNVNGSGRSGYPDYDSGIKVESDHNKIFENNCSDNEYGIYLDSSEYNNLADNNVSHNDDGIYIINSDNTTLKGNLANLNYHGITTANSDGTTLTDNKVSYNDGTGITINGVGNTLSNNRALSNGGAGIFLFTSSDSTLVMNNASGNWVRGIHLFYSDRNTLFHNVVEGNEDGIRIYKSYDNTLIDNTISDNNESGIYLSESNYNQIYNNTVIGNQIGLNSITDSKDNIAYNNNIFNNTEYGIDASSDSILYAIKNWWGDVSGPYHAENNSDGKGDNVTDNVDFDPWLGRPAEEVWTFYVDDDAPDGGNGSLERPYNIIQDAVNASEDGDTIRVFEGVYEENVVVDKSVEIIGNGSGETVIRGEGGAEFELTERGGYASGLPEGIAVDGNYLYIAAGAHGLIILDVTNASDPILLGRCDTMGTALDVVVDDDYAYIANGENGLVIIDIQNRSQPAFLSGLDTAGEAQAVVVEGDNAYLADGENGMVILDISDKINPSILGGINTTEDIRDIAIQGEYAFLVDYRKGVVIVNVSDPPDLMIEGRYDSENRPREICVASGYAYVADGNNGLIILEIINTSDLQLIGTYEHEGTLYDIEVIDDQAYLAIQYYGLEILNISDKENPRKIGEYYNYDDSFDVAVGNNLAFIAAGNWGGVLIIDISDENDPTLTTQYNTFGRAEDVEIDGDHAYVADYFNGVVVMNVSNKGNPVTVGHFDVDGTAESIVISGNFAYVTGWNIGFVIVDISNASNPIEVGYYETARKVYQVDIVGNLAYLAVPSGGDDNGLIILDITNKSDPQFVGSYQYDGFARGVEVEGNFAYIPDQGLVIVNVTNTSDPQLEAFWDGSPYRILTGLTVKDNYVYLLSHAGGGVRIIDVSDNKHPILRGSYFIGYPFGIDVIGDFAYVASLHDGMIILDVNDIRNPTYFAGYDTIGSTENICVEGQYAYVADGRNGLIIIEMIFPSDAALRISEPFTKLRRLTIRNGSRSGVLIDANDIVIEQCGITENNVGLKVINGSENIEISNCDIFENSGLGVNTWDNDGKSVNAINNWWGHPSGPYHPTLNPAGIGNEVSNNLNFEPWLTRPIDFKILHVSSDGNDIVGTGNKGNPFRTIQKAVDMAHDWDTIEVASGTYSGSITFNKRNVTIIGDSPDTTILDADGAATTCTITADDIELNGFTIKNGNDNGILMIDSSGNRIVNCVFPDNSYDLNLSNSKNNVLINTTFETVNFNDPISRISVQWPVDLKVTDNRSGFIPNAHLKITDTFGTTVFDGYTVDEGRIPQMLLLEYYQNLSSRIEYNSCTISIWKDGYLDSSEEYSITSYTRLTCQLQTHILPVAIISGEIIQEVNMDSMIFFDGTESTGRSLTHFWEFGDESSSTSPTPSHTYSIPGAYQVDLTVTDDYENKSMTSIIVIVENVDPTAQAETSTNSAFEDEEIQFDASNSWDTPSDIISFLWDFGDGTQTAYVSPIHVYQDEGDYEVRLTVIDMFGGKSTTNLYITITNIEPRIVETNVTGMPYPGKPLHFTVTADDTVGDVPSLEYSWDFGDGTIAQEQNVTHVFSKAGIFDVEVTVTDNNGAWDSAEIQIAIADPKITTFVSSTSILQDETVFFNASHELHDGSFVYTWYFGDGDSAMEQETSHIFTKSGIFTPRLMINDGTKNTTIFLQEIIVSNVVPVPNIISDKLSLSEDESVHFDASPTSDSPTDLPNLIYIWDFGDGTTSAGIDVTHAFSGMGNYTVVLTVGDGKTTRTTDVQVEVQNLAPVADAGIPKERKATEGEPVILDASGTTDTPSDGAELNYTWKIGSDIVYGDVVSFTFVTTGKFTVILIVRDNNGAVSEDTLTFEVSKSSESEDDETMSALSWILVVIIIALLVVIGFLISKVRDEALYKEIKAMEAAEEAIEMEEVIDEESFKPQDDVQETTVDVDEVQGGKISDAGNEEGVGGVGGGKMDDDEFQPPDEVQKATGEFAEEHDEKIPDAENEVGEGGNNSAHPTTTIF